MNMSDAPASPGTLGAASAPVTTPPSPSSEGHEAWWRWLLRCWPDTLFGRLALLLGLAVIISHVLALSLLFEFRPARQPERQICVVPEVLSPINPSAEKPYVVGRVLPQQLQPGGYAAQPSEQPRPRKLLPFSIDVGVRLAVLLLAAWLGARWLSQPMRRLAAAARELGNNINRPPLPETGTVECREASQVFNQMQERIQLQLQDRDRLVAAVSHDLRTPLTRLRLRAELLDDAETTQEFQRDIAEMEAMIQDTLDYLRGQAQGVPMVRVQLQALLQSVVDDYALAGVQIPLRGEARPVQAQPGQLRRCVDNLIANALRYGGGAEVWLEDGPQGVCITVRDHGPGLPDDALHEVMQPFVRMDASRHRHHGGVGLGLSIARDIALRHHGQLRLLNADDGGLCAVLELPHNQP